MMDKVIYPVSTASRLLIVFNLLNVLERECILSSNSITFPAKEFF